MKNIRWQFIFLMPVLLLMGFFLSSCCSPRDCEVKVTFIGVDEDLDLENYSYYVPFNEPTSITIDIPAGFDHTKVKTTINDHEQTAKVEFKEEIEDEYKYSIAKSLTYNIKFVKRPLEYIVDLTAMPKLKFDITLSNLSNFEVVTVKDPAVLDGLTNLNSNNIYDSAEFVNNVASVKYGEYAFLVHTNTDTHYDAMYSRITKFTPEINKTSIGTIEYACFDMAKKGNVRYCFNNDGYTSIYYIGQVKENINLLASIPNYQPDKGFDMERDPNIFYLFTNLSEYNSDLLTIETYSSINTSYNPGNINQDQIGEVTIEKVSCDSIFNDRYDMHKIYIGSNIATDGLLDTDQKQNVRQDLYLKVSSTIDLDNFDMKLLHYERDVETEYILDTEVVSIRGQKYLKITEEDMANFSLERSYIDPYDQVHMYMSGSAIFYPQLKYSFFLDDRNSGTYKYSRIWVQELIQNSYDVTADNFQFTVYIMDEFGNKNYGLLDYHYEGHTLNARDAVYFETSDLFDENNQYKNNLYCEIKGKEYKDYTSQTINNVNFYTGYYVHSALNKDPIFIANPKTYNGYKDFPVFFRSKEPSCEYTVGVKISVNHSLSEMIDIDFSHMNLGANTIYITNDISFEDVTDFGAIRDANKSSFTGIKVSINYDVFYFVRCVGVDDFDFDLYLDPNNRDTKISSSKVLCDATGEEMVVEINGEPYKVRVILQDEIFELLENGKIYALEQ